MKEITYKVGIWQIPLLSLKNFVENIDYLNWDYLLQKIDELVDSGQVIEGLLSDFSDDFVDIPKTKEAVLEYLDSLDFNTREEYFRYGRAKNELLSAYGLKGFIEALEKKEISADKVAPVFTKRILHLLLENNINYSKVSSLSTKELLDKVAKFKKDDKSTFSLARDRIFKSLVDLLPNINEDIRVTGGEISILKKELAKKARLLPTRKLIQSLPNLLPRLKPCIMMSPLTVSTYFSTNSDWMFDLVIFDEASQVKPEYAIAAISRGKQIIVAGDSKQMPPTTFFDSSKDNDEYEEDMVQDLESILDEFSVKIPETYLNWHYRSKDESLIAFSNRKFYKNRLFTFPTDNLDTHSNVRFTYVDNGLWESKSGNIIEAERVAKIVYEFAKKYPHKSLGVVAFGMSQAKGIEDKILELRETHPEIEEFFDESKKEPFFVKNLENVQGDERDNIILSVGYGKGPTGKIRMNFGPLTQSGGERRLNVAVSRAREIMHIVSSMRGSDVTVDDTTNENRIIFRDFLEFAEKGVGALIGYDLLEDERVPEFDSDFEENVYDYLLSEGYKVHTQVGSSGYRIDMGVVHPEIQGRYVLAIECDGAAYHSSRTARDRDRLRQEILESKGWNFYRIWSTTWIHDNENEKKSLLEAIEKAIKSYSLVDEIIPEVEDIVEQDSNLLIIESVQEKIALPFFVGDVYDFKNQIQELSDIIMLVATKYVGYKTVDLMRHINKEVFDKVRLTSGYKQVYHQSFEYLQEAGKIELAGDIIVSVST